MSATIERPALPCGAASVVKLIADVSAEHAATRERAALGAVLHVLALVKQGPDTAMRLADAFGPELDGAAGSMTGFIAEVNAALDAEATR